MTIDPMKVVPVVGQSLPTVVALTSLLQSAMSNNLAPGTKHVLALSRTHVQYVLTIAANKYLLACPIFINQTSHHGPAIIRRLFHNQEISHRYVLLAMRDCDVTACDSLLLLRSTVPDPFAGYTFESPLDWPSLHIGDYLLLLVCAVKGRPMPRAKVPERGGQY